MPAQMTAAYYFPSAALPFPISYQAPPGARPRKPAPSPPTTTICSLKPRFSSSRPARLNCECHKRRVSQHPTRSRTFCVLLATLGRVRETEPLSPHTTRSPIDPAKHSVEALSARSWLSSTRSRKRHPTQATLNHNDLQTSRLLMRVL